MDEWRELIAGRVERLPLTRQDDRRLLIEIAAIAVAAIEALDRKPLWTASEKTQSLLEQIEAQVPR